MIKTPTLFLEAFGQLAPATNRAVIVAEEEDLYSVFLARAELMHWSATEAAPRPMLWNMNDAELTAGTDTSRIGWVQVGLAGDVVETGRVPPQATGFVEYTAPIRGSVRFTTLPRDVINVAEPAKALPALIQCFDDALCRFGDVTLSGLQVTISDLQPRQRDGAGYPVSDLIYKRNWFNLAPQEPTEALIAFDHELLEDHTAAATLVASLQQWDAAAFVFGPVVAVPEPHWIQVPAYPCSLAPARCGVAVTMPEWTASAVAWALALVLDTARAVAPYVRHCAVRVTRVR